MAQLNKRLDSLAQSEHSSITMADRKGQVGSGMRGDKIRTYRFQDDVVQDHQSGKKHLTSKILSGNFDLLWS
jgi:peptide chain release factor 1